MNAVPQELVKLTQRLGEPASRLAILAEGNTSCSSPGGFWVKASGHSLCGVDESGFVECDPKPLLQAFGRELTDDQVKSLLRESARRDDVRPSVEAFMHAWLLTLTGVSFVGHVHPTVVLPLLCNPNAPSLCGMRFFPDEVVCCGPATAWVPYVDPGLPLAEKVRESVERFLGAHHRAPKVVWLQNHGVIALGATPGEVESALLMNAKAAEMIVLGGGVEAVEKGRLLPLSPSSVERIAGRQDEHYRQAKIWGSAREGS